MAQTQSQHGIHQRWYPEIRSVNGQVFPGFYIVARHSFSFSTVSTNADPLTLLVNINSRLNSFPLENVTA